MDAWGRLRVGPALRHFSARPDAPIVLVTDRDLSHPLFHSLLGYSDPRRRVAIVSTFRLGEERRDERLASLIAHECGHLRGLRHCRTPGCVMHPAGVPEELDSRGARACGRCPVGSPVSSLVLSALVLLLLFWGADRIGSWASPAHAPPFAWTRSATAATLRFNGRPVLQLEGRVPDAQMMAATEQLNAGFFQLRPAAAVAVRAGPGRAAIDWQGRRLLEFTEAQTGGAAAYEAAQRWAGQLNQLLSGKGGRSEVCPACHIDRVRDVEASAARSRRR